ncbi:hypothetical protein BX600DRAFT_517840 [Xylariales sp. PMI_506]|nr:hypothetical protein BX600DRAFT_517840 [Xylariales sp. PMI_506]
MMQSLPEELLVKVLMDLKGPWYFPGGHHWARRKSSLIAICRVSKQFRRIVQPLIYEDLGFVDVLAKPLLFRTLCEQPYIRQMVHFVQIRAMTAINDPTCVPEALHSYAKGAVSTGISESLKSQIMKGVLSGSEDALIALALSLMPCIERLDISIGNLRDMTLETLGLSTMANNQLEHNLMTNPPIIQRFKMLKSLRIYSNGTTSCQDPMIWRQDALVLFSYLESLDVNCITWQSTNLNWDPRFKVKLTSIHLSSAAIDTKSLTALIRLCPKLRDLHVTWDLRLPSSNQCLEDFDFCSFATALQERADVIENLDLRAIGNPNHRFKSYARPLGSLLEMRALRSLRTCRLMLVGTSPPGENSPSGFDELLPDGLETLHFTDMGTGYDELCALLANERLTRLRGVTVTLFGSRPRAAEIAKEIARYGWEFARRIVENERAYQRSNGRLELCLRNRHR